MLVVMKRGASRREIRDVEQEIKDLGYKSHPIIGVERTVIGAIGDERGKTRLQSLELSAGVERVIPILKPYKLAGVELHKEKSRIAIGAGRKVVFGGRKIPVIAGPCCVEGLDQILTIAKAVKKAGAVALRGGAYKPRTSPYSFQGLEGEGLELLSRAREATGLPVVTEVMKETVLDLVVDHADMIQIGARNMQNFDLLKAVGQIRKPVMLKRGLANTIREWLMSAEYIMSQGNMQVVLCERGIRTFETQTRNTLDLNAIAVLKRETHLPVVVDPSHGTGYSEYVEDMALAAVAAGADGLMVEVHHDPHEAWSDGSQSLTPEQFARMIKRVRKVARAVGRDV
ncbi:MAG: 3-deoxy-7-phosphoheptulonate synthase [Lentisphaerae bacterium RIFOXYC12_FULL_60_16]|nr:MAG: 3-deoxy-7-phosphoheptulonate synthase [Lentisphaerae bacterium RIFOXYC12_FULL_60_16]